MQNFSERLIHWYLEHKRSLPWRDTKDPYKIWLSEIILQQTRVDQGLAYYQKFVKEFDTVNDLANASTDRVLKLWQGLGYYSRARNLHAAAKQVVEEFNGSFPNNYKDLLKLKGVGEYTAAAIASFAFKEATPVVDGNVFRFLSRAYGVEEAIDTVKGKKTFKALAEDLIDKKQPDLFNQAIMEYGALQCTPKQPKCLTCPFQEDCFAFRNNNIQRLPIKAKKTKQTAVYLHYFILSENGTTYIQQRPKKGIWGGLFEFPKTESTEPIKREEVANEILPEEIVGHSNYRTANISGPIKHILSHRKISCTFWKVELLEEPTSNYIKNCKAIRTDEIDTFALPRLIDRFLEKEKAF